MRKSIKRSISISEKLLKISLLATIPLWMIPSANAANAASAAKKENASNGVAIEEIIITGSRRKARSPSDTPSPVDVITADQFKSQGGSDMMMLIRNVVPSYNVNAQPISDAASLVRPANLRGLPPDDTLVLINGKRFHRAAVITFIGGGLSDGSQGPDISVIPSIALKRVEVLRDGAAAQYGSDAIAGVINFILNDDPDGGSISAKYGKTYSGDGAQWQVAGTVGTKLGENGFLRGSVEYSQADPTSRSVQRGDALGLIAAGNTAVRQPYAQIWGSPKVFHDFKSFVNFAVEAGDNMEFYGFGNYADRTVQGGFYYRNPNTRGGVFSNNGGNTRLVGDMTPNDGQTCTGGINFATGNIDNPLVIGSAGEAAAMASIAADPNCFTFNEKFPGGFTPNFGGNMNDISGVLGLRGEFHNGITYDVNMGAGRNQAKFFINNTVNASLGSDTPTSFNLGSYTELDKTFSADFSYPLETGIFASPINVAAGFQWRQEQFTVGVGQPESFKLGVLAKSFSIPDNPATPNINEAKTFTQGFGIGSNGFSGFSPQVAGSNSRNNTAFYLDMETDVTDKLVLGVAVRRENFSDFGSKVTYKLSTLYHLTDNFTLRSTYSTGFRAPTVGQSHVSNITTVFETDANGKLALVQRGTIPPTNPVAMSQGGKQLQPETSKNFGAGIAYNNDFMSLTIDYFNIKMKDRITQGRSISLTQAQKDALQASGITGAGDLGTFRFFTNNFSTTTQGIDVVANFPLNITDDGTTNLNFVGNWTQTRLTNNKGGLISPTRKLQLEIGLPRYRGNVSLNHSQGNWRTLVRMNYYGAFYEAHADSGGLPIYAASKVTVDVEFALTVMDQVDFIVGAQNLLNTFPTVNPWRSVLGSKYPVTSPMGINGGFYYARVVYNF